MKHIIVFPSEQLEKLIKGKLKFGVWFFKKKENFLNQLAAGDTILFRQKGKEVLGQFEVGKIILIENLESSDWNLVKEIESSLKKEDFQEKIENNNIFLAIQISKLEQFITSPLEIPKGNKEWIILGDR